MWFVLLRNRLVPPTPVAHGDEAGITTLGGTLISIVVQNSLHVISPIARREIGGNA